MRHVALRSVSEWTDLFENAGFAVEETTGAKITLEFDAWVDRTGVPAADVAELHRRFREAPDGAHDLFEVAFADGGGAEDARDADDPRTVVSWANPKALMRVRKR